MKKIILLTLVLLFVMSLVANEKDDLKFAVGLFSDKNYKLAKVELENFIKVYPESKFLNDAKYILSVIYLDEENYSEVKKITSELYKYNFNSGLRADILISLAQSEYFLNDHRSAQIHFQEFSDNFPKHKSVWKVYYFLGKIAYSSDDTKTAEQNYKKAGKHHLSAKVALLEMYLNNNEPTKAENVVKELLKAKYKNEYRNQGLMLFHEYNLTHQKYGKIFSIGFETVHEESQYYDEYSLIVSIAYFESDKFIDAYDILQTLSFDKADYYKALCLIKMNRTAEAGQILDYLKTSENEEIKINSFFYSAKILDDPEEASKKLKKFANENPEHDFIGQAYYQIGLNAFTAKDFSNALNYLVKVTAVDNKTQEKAGYLIAESYFALKNDERAFEKFSEYLQNYSKGKFRDEAFFKIGLHHYKKNELPIALVKFEQIPQSSGKYAIANYYLGEIYFVSKKYDVALRKYKKALEGDVDKGYISVKAAFIYYNQKNFTAMRNEIEKIPDDEKYSADKYRLSGNLEFALKKYDSALMNYLSAESYTTGFDETLQSKIAWTLYQLNRFAEASEIYKQLSASSPEVYLMKAANAAFNAEDFLKAASLYTEYLDNFPEGKNINAAQTGLADSYYNLGDYSKAKEYYLLLISPKMTDDVLYNALNGLEWACEQSNETDFHIELINLLQQDFHTGFKLKLYEKKINYEFAGEQWDDVINTCNKYEQLSVKTSDDIRYLKGRALVQKGQTEEAEKIFVNLAASKKEPRYYYEIAMIRLNNNNTTDAISYLRQASMLTREESVWLKLLTLEQETGDDKFLNDYHKFTEFATGEKLAEGELLWVEHQIKNGNYDVHGKLKNISESKNVMLKAKAQYLKGYTLYLQKHLDVAVRELLRVRYLFPKLTDIRIQAEYLACKAYVEDQKPDDALQLFENIKDELPEGLKAELQNLLETE
jgi:TolA-binding protein